MKNAAYWAGRTVRETFDEHWTEDTQTGCWIWQRSRVFAGRGYGQLNVGGRPMLAHRFSWVRSNGPIPDGLYVLHHCDNPGCVNPGHLFLGTNADNIRDKVEKNRTRGTTNWRTRKTPKRRVFVIDKFDKCYKVDRKTGCWLWSAGKNQGYGTVRVGGKHRKAHRVSYERAFGKIPTGKVVRHDCDNPQCVNPKHLRLGRQSDNIADMYSRGRAVILRGERQGRAKLTEESVRQIRSDIGARRIDLAKLYGVSATLIGRICLRRAWKHVI